MTYFTIVTKSYYGLALTLKQSLIDNANIHESDFYIFLLDGSEMNESNTINVCDLIDKSVLKELEYKYDVTEFATSVKPKLFSQLLQKDSDVTYLDPDIYVFREIYGEEYESRYSNKLIHLTPHFLEIDISKEDYNRYLGSGAYNLGFCRIKKHNKTDNFLKWWDKMCANMCYRERDDHLFTDQKWLDLIFCFLKSDQIHIIRDYTFNVAPWNFTERKIEIQNNRFYITTRNGIEPIRFYHFSGFDYKNIQNKNSENNKFQISSDSSLIQLLEFYGNKLNDKMTTKYLEISSNLGNDEFGRKISLLQKRIFRTIKENNKHFDEAKFEKIQESLSPLSLERNTKIPKYNPKDNIEANRLYDLIIKFLFKTLRKLVGTKRYMDFLKYIRYLAKYENQLFLIKSDETKH